MGEPRWIRDPRQTDPGTGFLKAARTDLAAAYDSLRQPEKAARFKAELADTAAPAQAPVANRK